MKLEDYISDLLYRYECVIVPDFGGFITNTISANINKSTHVFYPPCKQISFNHHVKNNDGLLINYIASVDKMPYESAANFVKFEIEAWKEKLNKGELELKNLGSLRYYNDGFYFEQSNELNYLTSSFGLNSFASPTVKRLEYLETANVDTVVPLVPSTEEKSKKTPLFIKYAATIAILFAVGSIGWKLYNENQYQQQILAEQQQQQSVEQKIQQATFIINNPLPTITLNVAAENSKSYHIIAGAFRNPKNADKKVRQLIKKGYNAKVVGVNKWNLTQVSYGSFSNKNEALKNLRTIKNSVAADAWLLVK